MKEERLKRFLNSLTFLRWRHPIVSTKLLSFENLNANSIQRIVCRVSPLGALVVWLLLNSSVLGDDANPGLESFQRFVCGEEPIKEGVVYRRISRPDGTIVNQDWLRFGYQGNTWHAQRLAPDTNNPTKLLPLKGNDICGASVTHFWVISDNNVHVADKASSLGSIPDTFGGFPRNFMLGSIALGIPNTRIEDIRWDRSAFTTKVVSKRNPAGIPTETNTISGHLVLGADGLPVTAEYSGVGSFSGATVSYEYGSSAKEIPSAFTAKLTGPSGVIFRWQFLSLTLGKVDLEETGGYVPQMFADVSLPRVATLWTNDLPYTVRNNATTPAFATKSPKRTGSLIRGALAVVVTTFLALCYLRLRNKKQTTK